MFYPAIEINEELSANSEFGDKSSFLPVDIINK